VRAGKSQNKTIWLPVAPEEEELVGQRCPEDPEAHSLASA
jgi:hypothetical protein